MQHDLDKSTDSLNEHEDQEGKQDKDQAKVYAEDAKQDHTSHWDLDYLPKKEVDQAYQENAKDEDD